MSGLPPAGIVDPVSESLAYARSSTNPLQRAQQQVQQQNQNVTPARPSVRTRTGSTSIRSPASTSAPARGRGESGTRLAIPSDIAAPHPVSPPELVAVDAQPERCLSHEGGGASSASAAAATEIAVVVAGIEQPDSGRAKDVSPAMQAVPVCASQRSRGDRGRGGSDAVLRARPPPVVVDIASTSPEEPTRQFAHRRPSPRQVAQAIADADPMHGSAVGPVPPVGDAPASGIPAPALFPAEQRASADTEELTGSLGRVPTRPRLPRRAAVGGASGVQQ